VKFARACQFVEAVVANGLDAAEALLDPDVETVTPRGTFRDIGACRQVLQKASGDEQFAMEQAEPEFEEIEGDVIARTHEIARWRETGEVAYERDFAVRLTFVDERIVRVVVKPGGAPPSQLNSGSQAGLTPSGGSPTSRPSHRPRVSCRRFTSAHRTSRAVSP
jgi:hypothetical protein